MNIIVQLKTILFSIFFGVLFSISLRFNYKYIIGSRRLLSFILTFLFVIVFTLLYFIGLRFINFGMFHYYEIISIIVGFAIENLVVMVVEKMLKKWYTLLSKVGE